jgi:aspartate/methionine/tyrosine aminotransferase
LYRYSDRLDWTATANPFSTLLAESRRAGRPLLDLTVSNPTQALADYPHWEISAALGSVADFRYQPEPFGNQEARAAIARRLMLGSSLSPLAVSPEQVALTASTSEAYAILFKLLANPGEQVLVPAPSYPLFDYLARLESVQLRPYRLAYDGSWHIDFASLEAAISARTRAIIVVNPNNPTGSYLKVQEFARLSEIALAHSLPLISDEVFQDYALGESKVRVSTLAGQADVLSFSLNGLSKASAMPQMKLGWMVVSGPAGERERACASLELLMDTYLSVGAAVQVAAEKLLTIGDGIQQRIRLRLDENLRTLSQLLDNSPIHILHTEGGWSAVLRVPQVLSEDEWITRLLTEHDVIVQPGYFFDMPGEAFLVVSLLTPPDVFGEGITRMLRVIR